MIYSKSIESFVEDVETNLREYLNTNHMIDDSGELHESGRWFTMCVKLTASIVLSGYGDGVVLYKNKEWFEIENSFSPLPFIQTIQAYTNTLPNYVKTKTSSLPDEIYDIDVLDVDGDVKEDLNRILNK